MTAADDSGRDKQDIELNEAFARLEKQVEENRALDDKVTPTAKPAAASGARGARAEAPRQGPGFVAMLAMLLSFIALGLGSYGAYQAHLMTQSGNEAAESQSKLALDLRRLAESVDSLGASQSRSGDGLIEEFNRLAEEQSKARSGFEAEVAATVSELKAQLGTSSQDWLIAEAEYLLRLANQRVVMEDDVAGAISLFEAADEIINDAEGVAAFALREAIANDIAALRAVSGADVEGIFVQLGAAAKQIPLLQQKQLEFVPQPIELEAAPETETLMQATLRVVKQFGARVASLVDYRRDGEVVRPLLPPGEEYYLKQNLLLKVQLAQLGLLRGNQDIYQQSLQDAADWTAEHFDPDEARTISILATLTTLAEEQIERETPDVSSSLREIRKLMANFHQTQERGAP